MSFLEAWHLAFPQAMLVVLIVCAVLDAIGFYKFVYFLSVGYGLAVAGCGVAFVALYGFSMGIPCLVLCALFVLYGARLSGFLLLRETKNAAYRKTLKQATGGDKPMPVFVKAFIWVACALMYTTQVSPVLYRLEAGAFEGVMPIVSAVIMALALVLESVADKQKSDAKKKNPNRVCSTGLYKIVRCPNYLGEVLFWTGVLLSGIGALKGAVQWAIAILGYLLLVYVMFSGAKRLEGRQNKSYGDDPDYQAYVEKTPILLPLVPLYSLQKVGFIK